MFFFVYELQLSKVVVVVVVVYAVTGFKETNECVVKHTMTADEYDCCSSNNHRYLFTKFYISCLC